ncbi:MAG: ChaN family lipoprotein [Sneathiella sp.]|nr:ChaN family lipoprotein [Sneathiella sp.]
MTWNISFLFILLSLALSACTATHEAVETRNGYSLALQESGLIKRLGQASFIFLGEKHDNEEHHLVQAAILQQTLTSNDGVVFEMLNRDQQPVVDQFLKGDISYASLPHKLKWAKSGWPDWTYYGPLFKAAKDARARILYGSFPQRDLKDNMNATPDDTLPRHLLDSLHTQIRQSHCDLLPKHMIAPMSNIQIAKDKLLAKQLLQAKGQGRAFLIAGNGHVRKDRGAPYFLARQTSLKNIFVLGIVEDQEYLGSNDLFNRFDSVWTTASVTGKDYCSDLRKKFGK